MLWGDTKTHRQQGDLISLLFKKNKERKLKIEHHKSQIYRSGLKLYFLKYEIMKLSEDCDTHRQQENLISLFFQNKGRKLKIEHQKSQIHRSGLKLCSFKCETYEVVWRLRYDDNDQEDKMEATVAATMNWFLFSLLFTLVASGQNQGYRRKNLRTPSWLPSPLPLPVEETSREGDGILICKGKSKRRRGSKKIMHLRTFKWKALPDPKTKRNDFLCSFYMWGEESRKRENPKGLTELSA
jgi:hypothetical protein